MKNCRYVSIGEDGFTLIEALIAIVILVIGILSLYTMHVTSIKGNATANQITNSSDWASSKIEEIFGMPYDDDRLKAATVASYAAADNDHKAKSPDGYYTMYWNVVDDQPIDHLKTINIVVNRNDFGISKSVVMKYIKSEFVK